MLSVVLSAILALSGCSTVQNYSKKIGSNDDLYADVDNKVNQTLDKSRPVKQAPALHMPGPYLGARTVPLANQKTLPEVFYRSVTMIFPDRVGLNAIAERITRVTGVPTRVNPDVLGRQQGSTAIASSSSPAAASPFGGAASAPTSGSLLNTGSNDNNQNMEMALNYTGSFSGLLDIIAARANISWKYENNSIYFYRYETRTFVLRAIPGSSALTASVSGDNISGVSGGGGGASGGAGGGGGSSQNTSVKSDLSVWTSVESAIKSMQSGGGRLAMSMATGSITVTDTPEIIGRVAKLIEHENGRLGRQVNIKVQIFSVAKNDSSEYGINWNAVFANLSKTTKVTFASPSTSAISAAAGTLGIKILGQETNTDLMLKALSTQGDAALVTSAEVTTLNNQPVPINVTNQTSYLQAVTNIATANVGSSTSLQPGMVTTGFSMNLLPHVIDNDAVLLQYALDLSELENMNSITSGSSTIQTPEVSSRKFLQRVALRNGETLMLTGFERTNGTHNKNGLINAIPFFGGISKTAMAKESVVILITPFLVEGAI